MIDRFSLHGAHIDEVVGGAVVTHAKDWNLAREAVIGSALAPTTPGITMMQACGTSLQGALGLGAKIATGQIDCGIALGSDTASDAPIVFKRSLLSAWCSSRGQKASARSSRSSKAPRQSLPQPPSTSEPRTGLGMGEHCELMAKEWGITREAEDLLAYEATRRRPLPPRSGLHGRPGRPLRWGVPRQQPPRGHLMEKMAELKPVFDRTNGTITAANSTLTDGAATVLIASEEWAAKRGILCRPIGRSGAPRPWTMLPARAPDGADRGRQRPPKGERSVAARL